MWLATVTQEETELDGMIQQNYSDVLWVRFLHGPPI